MPSRVSRRAKVGREISRRTPGSLPDFIPPQLSALTDTAPEGPEWGHEFKWDGYRMHARIEAGEVRLLTRTGLDWTHGYPALVEALQAMPVKSYRPKRVPFGRMGVDEASCARDMEVITIRLPNREKRLSSDHGSIDGRCRVSIWTTSTPPSSGVFS